MVLNAWNGSADSAERFEWKNFLSFFCGLSFLQGLLLASGIHNEESFLNGKGHFVPQLSLFRGKKMCQDGEGGEEARGGSFVCLTELLGKKSRKWNPKDQKSEWGTAENLGRFFLNMSQFSSWLFSQQQAYAGFSNSIEKASPPWLPSPHSSISTCRRAIPQPDKQLYFIKVNYMKEIMIFHVLVLQNLNKSWSFEVKNFRKDNWSCVLVELLWEVLAIFGKSNRFTACCVYQHSH